MSRTSKRWSYTAITNATEVKIIRYMTEARETTDAAKRHMLTCMAYGAYSGWYELTVGWQKDGDDQRLETLTRI
ncbi:hypothetical protein R70006_06196 [Paraburkholderia domus]|uniref:hypothetical protein n=1 Tax=Paraburkholderia domus TaxID=2793075 RepID=UPI00191488D4|nr:hypothetical protein [Paraburkholderia domus]MBK5052828.1 hypothetical protein [Burkholderia sp. R-70006]CAE6820997.1 hypothetical protein R70006_06196 [Paraburkholderia domus]